MPPIADPILNYRMETLKIPCCTRTPEMTREIDALRQGKQGYLEKAQIACYEAWDDNTKIMDVPVQCLRIGDVALVGLPAEIFTAIGLEIKRLSPSGRTLIVEEANAQASIYVPTMDQAHRGGYGERPIQSRWLVAEAANLMIDAAIRMLHDIWNEK